MEKDKNKKEIGKAKKFQLESSSKRKNDSPEQEAEQEKQQNQKIQKNDFVQLEFIGKDIDGNIFDTNIEEQAAKINLNLETRPFIICIGQGMILPAIDQFLLGKSIGKYKLELTPDKAFGIRNPQLVKTMSISVFKEQNPQQGMIFQFDNLLGKISAVSGGRVIVDFNNPLAGKNVVYELDIKKIISDLNEKIKALIQFFFRKEIEHKIEGNKLIISCEPGFEKFINLFKPKFKEILNLDLEVKVEEKKKKQDEVEKKDEVEEKIQNKKAVEETKQDNN